MDSIAHWRERAVQRLSAARQNRNSDEMQALTDELRTVHIDLGLRRTGTREEQNTYLLARTTGTPLPELAAVGIDTNAWPPPLPLPAPAEPQHASPDTEQRITELFHAAGPLLDRNGEEPRYVVKYRPEDEQRYRGALLPWAIWDTVEKLAIAHHEDRELAEVQADRASHILKQRNRRR